MKILIYKNKKIVGEKVSNIIEKEIIKNPKSVISLASGETMISIYNSLTVHLNKHKINLSKVSFITLDEYVNTKSNFKKSFNYFLDHIFLSRINIEENQVKFIGGYAKNPLNYEKLVKNGKIIDIQLLGIGKNGHIGYNEPGSPKKSLTRIIKIKNETIKDKRIPFSKAITMGISTILNSKKIIIVATGKNKASIVKKFIDNDISSDIPATFLKEHKNTILILDKDAASKLK